MQPQWVQSHPSPDLVLNRAGRSLESRVHRPTIISQEKPMDWILPCPRQMGLAHMTGLLPQFPWCFSSLKTGTLSESDHQAQDPDALLNSDNLSSMDSSCSSATSSCSQHWPRLPGGSSLTPYGDDGIMVLLTHSSNHMSSLQGR